MHRRIVHSGSDDPLEGSHSTKNTAAPVNGGGTMQKRRKRRVSHSKESPMAYIKLFLVVFLAVSLLSYIVRYLFWRWWSSDTVKKLPLNPIYHVPNSHSYVGDRSDAYVTLRKDVDAHLGDPAIFHQHLSSILSKKQSLQAKSMMSDGSNLYDIHNCPDDPPAGYPFAWKTIDILKDWNPDETKAPDSIYQSLCVFDYEKDYDKAMAYRNASAPFIVVNDPSVLQTVARWNLPNYMDRLLGDVKHRTEYSTSNHFMFYFPPKDQPSLGSHENKVRDLTPQNWKQPTQSMRMSYADWFAHANVSDATSRPNDAHWYYRLVGCGAMGNDGSCDVGASEYLFDELPYFQPRTDQLYLVDPRDQEGIHCRFGMRGIISENHYDLGRNAIVVLGGQRRYILSHPDQCDKLALYPIGHPSARHSAVDWSAPDLKQYPQFAQAQSSEVVLQAGEVLYLPSHWFHFIVSLDLNFQCNTRSGIDREMSRFMRPCGF